MSFNMNAGYGRLIASALASRRPYTGKIFFVSGSSLANWEELSEIFPTGPEGKTRVFTTLQGAIDQVENNGDDLILVAPLHTETVTAAAGLDTGTDTTGMTILGLGEGNQRPLISFTTAVGADFDIGSEGVTIENIRFDLTGVDALTAPIDVNDAYCTFRNCEFETADSAGQCVLGILTDANADGFKLENCFFKGSKHAGTTAAVRIVGGTDHKIIGNTFIGAYTAGTGAIDNASQTAVDRTLVKDNYIWNTTAASTKAMVWASTSTVFITGQNNMQIYSGDSPITAAFGSYVGLNSYARVLASSVLIGTTSI